LKTLKIESNKCHLIIIAEITDSDGTKTYEYRSSTRNTYENIVNIELEDILNEIDENLFIKYDYVVTDIESVKIVEFQFLQMK
jgi:hypothetical protein